MNSRRRKRAVMQLFYGRFHSQFFIWRSREEQEWLDMVPVGREFGSPDYERLLQEDLKNFSARPADWSAFLGSDVRASDDFMEDIEDPPR